eukprot:g7970.t1
MSAARDLAFAFAVTNGSFPGVGQWDTRSLVNATAAFNHAMGFTQDLAGWDVRGLQLWDNLLQGAELYTHGLSAWAARLPAGRGACLWAFARTRVREQARAALCEPEFVLIVNSGYGDTPSLRYLDPAVVTSIPAHTFAVDWGDGTTQTCTQAPGTSSCTKDSGAYPNDQVFILRIRGDLHGLRRIGTSVLSIVAINSWGNVSLTTAQSSFHIDNSVSGAYRNSLLYSDSYSDLSSLSYVAPITGTQALRYVDNFGALFVNARSLVGDLRDWDVPLRGQKCQKAHWKGEHGRLCREGSLFATQHRRLNAYMSFIRKEKGDALNRELVSLAPLGEQGGVVYVCLAPDGTERRRYVSASVLLRPAWERLRCMVAETNNMKTAFGDTSYLPGGGAGACPC